MNLTKTGLARKIAARFGFVPARAERAFPAARVNRLTQDWRSFGISLDSLLNQDLATLRTRARDLQESNEYFQKFLSMLKANVCGDSGMSLKNKATDPPRKEGNKIVNGPLDYLANKLIEDAFWEWGKKENCTVAKNLSWAQVQNLALETAGTDGETLWKMVIGKEAGNKFNFALQPIETDRIDSTRNQTLAGGASIKLGVQRNSFGQITHYWLHDGDPTDQLTSSGNWTSRPYPAAEFVHPHLIRRIGQTRGIPWAAAAMMRLKMLADYEEAELVGSVAASRKMAFLTKSVGSGAEYSGPNADGGGKYMDAEAGMVEELPQGMDVKVVDWNHPNSVFGQFTGDCLRAAACALCVSHPNLANDYANVNFSSGRMARLEEVEHWKMLQFWFADTFHTPIFSAWLDSALMSNAIKVELAGGKTITLPPTKFEKFNQPAWHGRRWTWLDPTKEVSAKISEINSGFTSLTRVLAELNIDRDELFDEIESDRAEIERRKIMLPELYENAAQQGVNQPETPGESETPEATKPPQKKEVA